ncbi:MAG: PKD domain-containing protein, partial [Bacteroidota bacterium]
GTYEFQLTVSDGILSSSDVVTVTVSEPVNLAPTVEAGPNASTLVDTNFDLLGSVLDDGLPNNSLTVLWTVTSGDPANVNFVDDSNPTSVVTFSAEGTYELTLSADDGELNAMDVVTITVNEPGTGPFALDAIDGTFLQGSANPSPLGNIIRVESGNRVAYLKFDLSNIGDVQSAELKMNVASDPGNGTFNVFLGTNSNWTETGLSGSNAPGQDGASLGSLSGAFNIGQEKTWILDASRINGGGFVTLIVVQSPGGNDAAFASDETNQAPQLIVNGSGGGPTNEAPNADAGNNQNLVVAQGQSANFTLDGSGSSDSDGTIQSYIWSENGNQIGTGVQFNLSRGAGTYTFTLTVQDDDGATDTDNVTINITEESNGNVVPVAQAGPNQSLTVPQGQTTNFTLDGSGSSDADGSIVSYTWTEGGNQVGTTAQLSLTRGPGIYTFVLTVEDNDGATDTDNVTVTISEENGDPAFAEVVLINNGQEYVLSPNFTTNIPNNIIEIPVIGTSEIGIEALNTGSLEANLFTENNNGGYSWTGNYDADQNAPFLLYDEPSKQIGLGSWRANIT